ncbi:MAG: tRNA uridine-5-carboxymethylaminomethyl(34) synthesis GTPase MnmE [Alphaproteobacteria bacterium]|nr:tRNA uridine-5-carboxymethylaminomethyl(34) synthesis GTPase MnmE [Rickettsiales bacterium]
MGTNANIGKTLKTGNQFNGSKNVIFASVTGVGGAINVVRVSGYNLEKLNLIMPSYAKLRHRFATLVNIIDPKNNSILDSALATLFKEPNSFTGENVIEISLHGSTYINRKIFDLLANVCGFQIAQRGEFSKRAFLNGKMDLLQAEGINAVIRAQTKIDHQIANEMLYGLNSKLYSNWRSKIINILTKIEVSIDFPEEDVEDFGKEEIMQEINNLLNNIQTHVGNAGRYKKLQQGISVGIFGEPNVGKSSLLNAIAGQEIAITTNIAGTTRDILSVNLEIGGVAVTLVDTAGIRESDDEIEKEGIKRALNKKRMVDIGILVIDATKPVTQQLASMQNFTKTIEDIIVLNKIDIIEESTQKNVMQNGAQLNANSVSQLQNAIYSVTNFVVNNKKNNQNPVLKTSTVLAVSAETKKGINELMSAIEEVIKTDFIMGLNSAVTSDRSVSLLAKSAQLLETLTLNDSSEIIASNLHSVATMLSTVVGQVGSEDVLDSIFGAFCIGK